MDFNSLTLREVAEVERLGGAGIATLGDDNAPKAAMMTALAFVLKRREDPKFTYGDAEELTFTEVLELIGGDENPLGESA